MPMAGCHELLVNLLRKQIQDKRVTDLYLNEFDREMEGRSVKVIRYADDIVVLAKSKRAAKQLLESCLIAEAPCRSGWKSEVYGTIFSEIRQKYIAL